VLVLNAGAVLADGTTAEVLARSDVIAAYLGGAEDEAA
jgi:ABC-type branched-subunit amino acid transport system ATPase component